jgi:ChrR Cupin-like domain
VPKPQFEFFDPEETMEWTPIPHAEGLSEMVLARDDESGDLTRLLRFAAGTDTTPMGIQRHEYWEEIWIVEGAIHDLSLDQIFGAGMYACRPPGMAHGPWRAPDGCVMFEQRYSK